MNRFVSIFAMVVLASAVLVSASYEDSMALIFAQKGSPAASFEETQAALKSIVDELGESQQQNIATDPMMSMMYGRMFEYYNVSQLDKAQCAHRLASISAFLDETNHFDAINLLPYLQECQTRQEKFCA